MPGELTVGNRIYEGTEKIVESKDASEELKKEGILKEDVIIIEFQEKKQ